MGDARREVDAGFRCAGGIVFLALGLFLALSVFSYDWGDISLLRMPPNDPPCNLIGPVGSWLSFILFTVVGMGAYLVPFLCVLLGVIFLLNREARVWPRVVWGVALLLAFVGLFELGAEWWTSACRKLNIVDTGGIFGRLVMRGLLIRWFSTVGAGIFVWAVLLTSLVLLLEIRHIATAGRYVGAFLTMLWERGGALVLKLWGERQRREVVGEQPSASRRKLVRRPRREPRLARNPVEEAEEAPAAETLAREDAAVVPEPRPAEPVPEPEPEVAPKPDAEPADYELPPLSLLKEAPTFDGRSLKTDTATTAKVLIETLADFGIEAEVTNVQRGPVVTRYELLPAPGVRIERISGLSNNLALSLKATSVRVQAPIPGKGVVGIEVPNSTAKMVSLQEVLGGEAWTQDGARLPLVLGKDVGGKDIVADLTTMPHLLIAGATGSGKTVCMNSILAGLLMSRTPEELRLMLVDPKIVEFSVYNHLPHLVVPVVTSPKKVALGLRWAINEMEKRYRVFAKVGVRNIESYNNRPIARQEVLFDGLVGDEAGENQPPERVPYIVIIIDELADLMLVDQAEIENCVARLAQLSRAVGIHMILSTQRPSVNVITGTIKANFPARIAFQVAQKVDSRTILDTAGADKLLGRGDMLFLPPGSSKLVRAQGAMTTDEETRNIVEFIKSQAEPHYETAIKEKLETRGSKMDEEADDELLAQAVEIIRETGRASTSSLQRRLRIGYTRAARLMDILEERGIVGPPRGSDPREILVDLDGEIPNNQNDEEEG